MVAFQSQHRAIRFFFFQQLHFLGKSDIFRPLILPFQTKFHIISFEKIIQIQYGTLIGDERQYTVILISRAFRHRLRRFRLMNNKKKQKNEDELLKSQTYHNRYIVNPKFQGQVILKFNNLKYLRFNNIQQMAQESIDFGNFSRKILMNPSVPLQILQLYYRNNYRVQATLFGKVYSNAIEILEIVPVGLCKPNQIEKIDYREHSRSIENLKSVYPNLLVLGVAVTDLEPDRNLAVLHTLYSNKSNKADELDSEFKPQGILTHPLIVSIGTKINEKTQNFDISAYTFNKPFFFCKDFLGVTSFEKLQVTISFGDADIQSMAPLFQAMNDQQKFVPSENVKDLAEKLIKNLEQLKTYCELSNNEQLRVKIRRIIDRLRTKHDFDIEQLSYLLDYASLQRLIGNKINRMQSESKS